MSSFEWSSLAKYVSEYYSHDVLVFTYVVAYDDIRRNLWVIKRKKKKLNKVSIGIQDK